MSTGGGEVLRPRPWESDIRYRYVGVVWRGETPPSRRSRAGKEEVPPPMTRRDALVAQVADGERRLSDVRMQVDEETDRLECLRQRADGVARDVEELRPIATEVRGWEAAGKAERGAILDNIVVKCDGLASRIRAGVAGIRIKVEELRSRISRPLEYLMRREQPRQQSLNDVLRDAQRAADAWNRDHAAPQRTYRGRAR